MEDRCLSRRLSLRNASSRSFSLSTDLCRSAAECSLSAARLCTSFSVSLLISSASNNDASLFIRHASMPKELTESTNRFRATCYWLSKENGTMACLAYFIVSLHIVDCLFTCSRLHVDVCFCAQIVQQVQGNHSVASMTKLLLLIEIGLW